MTDGAVKVTLTKPVTAFDVQVTEIALRRPTPLELRQCGQPYLMTKDGVAANYEACTRLLLKLCDPPLPGPVIDNDLDPADFDELCMRLVGFTKPAPRGVGSNTSGSSAS